MPSNNCFSLLFNFDCFSLISEMVKYLQRYFDTQVRWDQFRWFSSEFKITLPFTMRISLIYTVLVGLILSEWSRQTQWTFNRFFDHDGVIFSGFYQNGVRLKKITNLGKSCLIGTTSYAKVVPIRHDFCHVILKSCQLGTTSAMSYWSHANLARLLPCHTEVVPTWHDFCHIIIFNFIVYILGTK